MSTNTQKNAPVSAEPVAQYYYKVTGCPAVEASDDKCICWHDKGTGPHPEAQVGDIYSGFTLTWRRPKPTAPIATQPDLTQQTLDDVMACIPARDAEIAALRKEIETLQAAQAQQYVSGGNLADRLDVLADTASPGSQMQSDLYAAATIWRKHLKGPAAQQPVSGADGLLESPTRGMSLGQRIAHVGGRENAQGYIEFGSPMAVDALIQHILRDLTTSTPQGAFQARYRMPGGKWSSWGAVTCGVKGHEQELRYLETEGQHIGGFDAWIKREYPHLGPIGDCVAIAREAWSAALAQQDAEKVDAERWRAYRASAAADDAGFLQRALNAIEAMGLEDGQLPSEDQIDAAIDAARKEPGQ